MTAIPEEYLETLEVGNEEVEALHDITVVRDGTRVRIVAWQDHEEEHLYNGLTGTIEGWEDQGEHEEPLMTLVFDTPRDPDEPDVQVFLDEIELWRPLTGIHAAWGGKS